MPVGRDHAYLAREMELGTAIVFLDRPQQRLAADTITLDDRGGARAGTEHLLAHGHRRIGFVAQSLRIYTMTERRHGYLDALASAGIDPDEAESPEMDQPFDCAGSFKSESGGISLMRAMQSDDPTAIVGLPLITVAAALREAGYRVP